MEHCVGRGIKPIGGMKVCRANLETQCIDKKIMKANQYTQVQKCESKPTDLWLQAKVRWVISSAVRAASILSKITNDVVIHQ